MDSKQFGVYALIIAAVVLIAIGFNNVTGQVGKTNTCIGSLVLQSIPSTGGVYFKAILSKEVTKFDNTISIKNIAGGTYTAKFDCGETCNVGTLASKNGITKRSDGKKEIVTPTKTILPAGSYIANIKDPCSEKKITSSFTIR